MRVLLLGDLHLDALGFGVERFAEVRDGLQQAVTAAIRREVDLFVFLGDACNPGTSRAPRAIAACVEAAEMLSRAGIRNVWLVGNHDVVEDGSGAHTLLPLKEAKIERCTVVDEPIFLHDLGVVALPYVPLARAYDPVDWVLVTAEKYKARGVLEPALVIGHMDIRGAVPGSESAELSRGRRMFWPTDEIRKQWPGALMVGGHLHTPGIYDGVHVVGAAARFTIAELENEPAFMIASVA